MTMMIKSDDTYWQDPESFSNSIYGDFCFSYWSCSIVATTFSLHYIVSWNILGDACSFSGLPLYSDISYLQMLWGKLFHRMSAIPMASVTQWGILHLLWIWYTLSLLTLGSGESDLPPCGSTASSSITLAWYVCKSRGDNMVHMWVQLKRWCGCYRGGIVVMDVIWCWLCVSMIWGKVIYLFWVGQGVRRGSISSELLMCGGGMSSI